MAPARNARSLWPPTGPRYPAAASPAWGPGPRMGVGHEEARSRFLAHMARPQHVQAHDPERARRPARSVGGRQSVVSAGGQDVRPDRRDDDLARPRRSHGGRRHARQEVPADGGVQLRDPSLSAAQGPRRDLADEQGRLAGSRRASLHDDARASFQRHRGWRAGHLWRRAVRLRPHVGGRHAHLPRRRHRRILRHGADRRALRAGRRAAADRRPLHHVAARGRGGCAHAQAEVHRAVALWHVPGAHRHARDAGR